MPSIRQKFKNQKRNKIALLEEISKLNSEIAKLKSENECLQKKQFILEKIGSMASVSIQKLEPEEKNGVITMTPSQNGRFVSFPDAVIFTLSQTLPLRKTLEFYANPDIYKPHPHGPAFDKRDLSFLAINTLERFVSNRSECPEKEETDANDHSSEPRA